MACWAFGWCFPEKKKHDHHHIKSGESSTTQNGRGRETVPTQSCRGYHLTSPHLTSPHLTLPYLTLPYLTLPDLTLPYLTLPYLTLPYLTLPYLNLTQLATPHNITPHHTTTQHNRGKKAAPHHTKGGWYSSTRQSRTAQEEVETHHRQQKGRRKQQHPKGASFPSCGLRLLSPSPFGAASRISPCRWCPPFTCFFWGGAASSSPPFGMWRFSYSLLHILHASTISVYCGHTHKKSRREAAPHERTKWENSTIQKGRWMGTPPRET